MIILSKFQKTTYKTPKISDKYPYLPNLHIPQLQLDALLADLLSRDCLKHIRKLAMLFFY